MTAESECLHFGNKKSTIYMIAEERFSLGSMTLQEMEKRQESLYLNACFFVVFFFNVPSTVVATRVLPAPTVYLLYTSSSELVNLSSVACVEFRRYVLILLWIRYLKSYVG